MAQIKQFTRTVLPTQLTQVSSPASAFGGDQSGALAAAGAISGVGEAVGAVAAKFEEIQTKKDESDYVQRISQFQLENLTRQQELSTADFEEGADLAQIFASDVDERASELEIPDSQQARFQADLANMRLGFAQDGVREQARRTGIRAKLNFENTLDNANSITARDPLKHEEARRLIQAQVQTMSGSAEDRAKILDAAFDDIQATRASTILSADPVVFKEMVSAGEFDDLPNLQKFIQSADGAINRIKKEASDDVEETTLLNGAINGTSFLDPANSKHKNYLISIIRRFQSVRRAI